MGSWGGSTEHVYARVYACVSMVKVSNLAGFLRLLASKAHRFLECTDKRTLLRQTVIFENLKNLVKLEVGVSQLLESSSESTGLG